MIRELNGSFYLVLPQRQQVIEIVEHYDGFPIGKRIISNLSYVSYQSFNLNESRRAGFSGKMIPGRPLEKMTKLEIANELMEHIYGENAYKVKYVAICA